MIRELHHWVFVSIGFQGCMNDLNNQKNLTDLVEREITNIPKVLGRNINVFLWH